MQAIHAEPATREVDLLLSTGEVVSCALMALALQALGVKARALTGAQAGIITDGTFSRAAISSLEPGTRRSRARCGRSACGRGLPGCERGEPRRRGHHARQGWFRHDSGRGLFSLERRLVRDLHRCGWRFHGRSSHSPRRDATLTRRACRDAGDGAARRPRDAPTSRRAGRGVRDADTWCAPALRTAPVHG